MPKTMDIYARVSRVGSRDGESYRSPKIQIEECRRWAVREGVSIGKVVQEEDVSGGRAVKDRALEELIVRAEKGASDGVIVYKGDRFSRDTLQTLMAVKRLRDAGARFVGVTDGLDSDSPGGKMQITLMSALAEQHLDGIRAGWNASISRAVEDGIHVAHKAPIGYLRADQVEPDGPRNGRLVQEPRAAEVVKQAFGMRAEGRSMESVAEHIRTALDRSYSKQSAARMIRNEVYLGHAKGPGGALKKDAHDPIVTPELFAAANKVKGAYFPQDGSLASQALLSGFVRCAGCGKRMHVGRNSASNNRASYTCGAWSAKGRCSAPASASVQGVDELVLWLLEHDEGAESAAASEETRWLAAKEKLRDAEQELDLWIEDHEASAETRRRMILRAERASDDARAELYALPDPGLDDDAEVVWLDGKPTLYSKWNELSVEQRRRVLRRYVGSVTVSKADPKRRRWQPISERVEVRWVDGSEPVVGSDDRWVQPAA